MSDKTLIEGHGGPAALAEKLGYDKKKGGVQRVHNWLTRGIPASVKLERPDLFLRGQRQKSRKNNRQKLRAA